MANAPYARVSNAQIAANRKARFFQLEELRTKMAVSGMVQGRGGMQRTFRGKNVRGKPKQSRGLQSGSPFAPAEGLDYRLDY